MRDRVLVRRCNAHRTTSVGCSSFAERPKRFRPSALGTPAERKTHSSKGSRSRLAFQTNAPLVLFSNPLRNRQSQTSATRIATAGRISAIKTLENMGEVGRRYSDARITHQDVHVGLMSA